MPIPITDTNECVVTFDASTLGDLELADVSGDDDDEEYSYPGTSERPNKRRPAGDLRNLLERKKSVERIDIGEIEPIATLRGTGLE